MILTPRAARPSAACEPTLPKPCTIAVASLGATPSASRARKARNATPWPVASRRPRVPPEPTGLPAEAIYPQDRIADLWRMQWDGPDHLDLVFRLERTLAIRIGRPITEKIVENIRSHRDGEFREFAAAVVRVLGEATGPT